MPEPLWLTWARELQAIAQNGLAYAENGFDIERYQAIRRIAVAMAAEGAGLPEEKVAEIFATDSGYATPKVDVRGGVIREGRILLVREATDGCWSLPGGWADVNQSPRECVEREILEESGFEARACKLVAVLDRNRQAEAPAFPFHIYKLFFLCELTGGSARPSLETTDVGFFAPDALPELSLGRTLPRHIELLFAHLADPALPAAID